MARFIEKSLKGHPSMQATVKIYYDGTIELVSYVTTIVRAEKVNHDDGSKALYRVIPVESGKYSDPYNDDRIYSPTTARHISLFLREYFPEFSYQEFKKAALNKNPTQLAAYLANGHDLSIYW